MTFLVQRKGSQAGRFEIRESVTTPAGPRARTLATFLVLSDDVLDLAASRAMRPFDRGAIEARARALGVPRIASDASRHARALLADLRRGQTPASTLTRLLRDELPRRTAPVPDTIEPLLDWIGAREEERGNALRDLLRLASRVPARPRSSALTFPRLAPAA